MKNKLEIFILLFFFSFSFNVNAQDTIEYYNEETKAINDIFLNTLVDTSYYYYYNLPELILTDSFIIDCARDTILLYYFFTEKKYYPFNFHKNLIDTNGDLTNVQELRLVYNHFKDSVNQRYDKRRISLEFSGALDQFNLNDIKLVDKKYRKKLRFAYDLDTNPLNSREFNFDNINTGKYIIKKNIEKEINIAENKYIGSISISRIAFNSSFDKGIFKFIMYKGPLSAYCDIIYIEKVKNKWKVKHSFFVWIS